MQIGIIGLGKMGANITRRLQRDGHHCVVFDTNQAAIKTLVAEGAEGADTVHAMVQALSAPRAIWLMLPAGEITENAVNDLAKLMAKGDILIDGGNSFYKDDVRRAKMLAEAGLHYIDVGTSGGVWGLERGFCMMIGGEPDIVQHLDPIFKTLAPGAGSIDKTPNRQGRDPRAELGYIHAGPNGAGHFVKMVHNGIEYGLMQAYAEGFDVLRNKNSEALPADQRYDLDMADIAEVWRRGSVISSWLLDLTASALSHDAALSVYSGYVADSGEGRWTLDAAIEEAVPANVLAASLFARFRSREEHTFGEKLLSAMRQEFGGHIEQGGGVKK
jgi:6-phosphogluconate dehydrogenase